MTIFETHAHYDDERFGEDRASLLNSMEEHGIAPIINVGSTLDGAKESLALAKAYPFVYAAIGVHPSDIETLAGPDSMDEPASDIPKTKSTENSEYSGKAAVTGDPHEWGLSWIREHASEEKVVAIGEIGLDYYWEKNEAVREQQRYYFKRQLELAREAGLPVIIHSREACEDTLTILKEAVSLGTKGVMHCFSYSPEIAEEYVKMGFYLGIGGVVTFKNAKKLKETVTRVPLSSLVVETDCPYLAPEPFRGKRNESTYLPYVVQAIAKLREITEEQVIIETAKNARRLFPKVGYRT